jgi:dTDP-4-dehydrorhamnose reductase
MKWLITGCNGQLGKSLQYELAKIDSAEIIAFDSTQLDITDEAAIKAAFTLHKPDVVINAAAYTAVDKAESEIDLAEAINVSGPKYLASACEANGVWFVHVSTDYVFDGKSQIAYREDDLVSPASVYGRTKLQGEQAVAAVCKKYFIVRTAWVFSEYGNNFVKTMLRLGRERDSLGVVADQIGCPTYAGDIAKSLIELVERGRADKAEPGIYHYAGDLAVSWWAFTREIHAQALSLGLLDKLPELKAITTSDYPTPAARPVFSVLDTSKIFNLGIAPSDWRLGLCKVLEYKE